jgi:hypothetical protein
MNTYLDKCNNRRIYLNQEEIVNIDHFIGTVKKIDGL